MKGHEIGRHRTARLMRETPLIARQKRRFKRMTDSEHAWPVAPNLVAQVFTADGPDRKWGADISYIWTPGGRLSLAVVLNLFSRRAAPGLVHHSDRGSQYCPVGDQALLRRRGTLISLSALAGNRLPAKDERARELLRHLDGLASGKQSTGLFSDPPHLLQDHQVGPGLAGRMAIPTPGRKRCRQIHRRVP